MKKLKQKGFTIIEMVIVIAVIAILAAVLIPTYASLIQKSRLSSDEIAVKDMNTVLMAEEKIDGKIYDFAKTKEILAESGFRDEGLLPVAANHRFFWNEKTNRIILGDISQADNYKVTYPEDPSYVSGSWSDNHDLSEVAVVPLGAGCYTDGGELLVSLTKEQINNGSGLKSLLESLNINENEINKVVIPDGTTILPSSYFFGCTKLQSVTIPSSMVTLERYSLPSSPCEIIFEDTNNWYRKTMTYNKIGTQVWGERLLSEQELSNWSEIYNAMHYGDIVKK